MDDGAPPRRSFAGFTARQRKAGAGNPAPALSLSHAHSRALNITLPGATQGTQFTSTPLVKLKVEDVQKAAALRYHTW
jgi:hypothetical protein